MRARPLTAVAATAATLVLVAGCSGSTSAPETADLPPAASRAQPGADAGLGRSGASDAAAVTTLTQEQIAVALLTETELPSGWTQDASSAMPLDAGAASTEALAYDPPQCAAVVSGLAGTTSAARVPLATGTASFGGRGFAFVSETIETWEPGTSTAELDTLTAALPDCAEYSQTAATGQVTTTRVTTLDVPEHGDRTLALRLEASSGEGGMNLFLTLDVVLVVAGDVAVTLLAGGTDPLEPELLQEITDRAMAKVASA
ncbi:hypothetical protein [Cellulomonas fimi]|uniref:PknH-like extracellular domain-containing protein n=1 Tax=Cellulomonas fimi TaxID=1708 RepID=A0A7Y0LYE1_CELFI|nr:hypothetical protein [Cellulomonas fimi]NMR20471.1 hypothetical protein [Cellulomonas fimi]